MRTLTRDEIDQVSGGIDSINVGGVSITGIDAGLALRNVMGAAGVAFAAGYGTGTLIYNGYTAINGQSIGTDLYQYSN
jgi:hypothetical protein